MKTVCARHMHFSSIPRRVLTSLKISFCYSVTFQNLLNLGKVTDCKVSELLYPFPVVQLFQSWEHFEKLSSGKRKKKKQRQMKHPSFDHIHFAKGKKGEKLVGWGETVWNSKFWHFQFQWKSVLKGIREIICLEKRLFFIEMKKILATLLNTLLSSTNNSVAVAQKIFQI